MKNFFSRLVGGVGGLSLMITMIVHASGPSSVAKLNTDFWPDLITSKQDYDKASRAEILLFLSVYNELFSTKTLDVGVKNNNLASLDSWKTRFKTYWPSTFLAATKTCKNSQELGCDFKEASFEKLLNYSEKFAASLPPKYDSWKKKSKDFYHTYLKEQARLAALFPNPTSEILPLTNSEILGDHFKDGEFLITLDDGPTQKDGTLKYAQLLRTNEISAFFFVLGDALDTKLKRTSKSTLKTIYKGHCLASHGYHHKSHQKWAEWKSSLDKTSDLIKQINGNNAPVQFRPPYGQTQESLIKYLESQHSFIFLWNIDSQDWQTSITPEEVSVRVKKLMLLWRKGIILFHDVHKKGLTAIPEIIQLGKIGNLHWIDCETFVSLT